MQLIKTITPILLFVSALCTFGQESKFKFRNYSIIDGLSHNTIECIHQDSKGFIWIGTLDGLNKFDGYNFKISRAVTNKNNSLKSNSIRCIFEDKIGNIWFGTTAGLSVYNYKADSFSNYGTFTRNGLNSDVINSIVESKSDILWIGTSDGLYNCNRNTRKFEKILLGFGQQKVYISCLVYKNGNLWIGTHNNGLLCYNLENMNLEVKCDSSAGIISSINYINDSILLIGTREEGLLKYNTFSSKLTESMLNLRLVKSNNVSNIYKDKQDNIWVCTENSGLYCTNINGEVLQRYTYDDKDNYGLSNNAVSCIMQDIDGNYWIGTRGTGFNFTSKNDKPFTHVFHIKNTPTSLSSNNVTCFNETQTGEIMIGTDGGGMNMFNPKTNKTENPFTNSILRNINSGFVLQIASDNKHNYWLATWGNGIKYFTQTGQTTNVNFSQFKGAPKLTTIMDLTIDNNNRVWLSSFGEGVFVFDPSKNSFENKTFTLPPKARFIRTIKQDSDHNIWIGYYGLGVVKIEQNRYVYYSGEKLTNYTFYHNIDVNSIYEDCDKNIWLGTDNGLYKFAHKQDSFVRYTQADGLPNNNILSILEDNHQNLWMGTNAGLVVFNRNSKKVKCYDVYDGLQSNQFNAKSAYKTSNGFMLFGGVNGFSYFHPDSIKDYISKPRVYITSIKINNSLATVGDSASQIPVNPIYLNELKLTSDQKTLTFSFVAINYISTAKNQYAYRLEGFEKKWNNVGSTQVATYTNLNPGEYVFNVKASNNDGYWNNAGATIKITVLPPFYKTKFAFVIYLLFLATILAASRRYTLRREKLKNTIEFERYQARKTHELDMAKIKFFTNISHEFRTPLTLVLGPLEKFLKIETNDEKNRQYFLMYRNVRRLLFLINQLMDFKKMEAGSLKLQVAQADIIQFIKNISSSFNYVAEQNNIDFSFVTNTDSCITWFDTDKIEKIVYNLLSNAFKFTPANCKIGITLKYSDNGSGNGLLEIQVSDSGIGISEEHLPKIFDMFYQVENNKTFVNQGSGIGLAFTKELVELHNGSILVESKENEGATFIVNLPLPKNLSYSTNLQVTDNQNDASSDLSITLNSETIAEKTVELGRKKKFHLLIAEDNADLRLFIKENLEPEYAITATTNGAEAYESAKQLIPDLIISDIIMPKMDGIALCKELKNNELTSHIPVILLTSKSADDEIIEGFTTGADDYIPKPFNFQLLEIRIKNLIDSRIKLQERFTKKIAIEPSDIAITSVDEKLIQRALKIVEDNIENADFSVEEFSNHVGMSRVHLYRKIHSLTGKTPLEFIRIMRLKRAAQYLKESQLTVSEICYKVGFKDVDYFRKVFKKEFNMLPTEFAAKKE